MACDITLKSDSIGYLGSENWTRFQDVYIQSQNGERFGFNRCMLASVSPLCKELFLLLYECPLANLDETIYISSDYTSSELETLRNLLLLGVLPENSDQPSFQAIGLDLSNVAESFKQSRLKIVSTTLQQTTKPVQSIPSNKPGPWPPDSKLPDEKNAAKDKVTTVGKLEVKMDFEADQDIYPDENFDYNFDDTYAQESSTKDVSEEEEVPLKRAKKTKKKVGRPKAKQPVQNKSRKPVRYEEKMTPRQLLFYFPDISTGMRDFSLTYQCPKCCRGFSKPWDYRQHMHRHDLGSEDYSKAYFCDHCEAFATSTNLKLSDHIKQCPVKHQHDDTNSKFTYFCAVCPDGPHFNTSWLLLAHLKELHKELTFGAVTNPLLDKDGMCAACGTKFLNPDSVRKHMETEGPFHKEAKCNYPGCRVSFTSWSEHKDHLDTVHGGVWKFPCHHCGLNLFDTENEQRNHMTLCRIHRATCEVEKFDEKHVACTICHARVIATTGKTRNHLTDFHPELGKSCKICPSVPLFFTEKSLNVHMYTCHKNRHKCDQCDKDFPNLYRLRDHKLSHTAGRKIPCELCGACFMREGDLKKHLVGTHGGVNKERLRNETRTKICEICGKEVPWGQKYRYHMQYKHGTKNLECSEEGCGFKANNEMALESHMRSVHTFKVCHDCGKEVKQVHFKAHVLTHHSTEDQKPHQCTICQKGFVTKMTLKDHMNTHTGERPYQCKFCTKTSANNANCNKHMRESHPEEYRAYQAARKEKALLMKS